MSLPGDRVRRRPARRPQLRQPELEGLAEVSQSLHRICHKARTLQDKRADVPPFL